MFYVYKSKIVCYNFESDITRLNSKFKSQWNKAYIIFTVKKEKLFASILNVTCLVSSSDFN
jgi:hypothetical protein